MKVFFFLTSLSLLFLSACGTVEVSVLRPMPAAPAAVQTPTTDAIPLAPPASEARVLVAYVKDGDVFVWDEATGQSKTVFPSGDVTRADMSDDGQVIALVRQSEAGVALWAVDWNGRNPRELVSAVTIRQRLESLPSDSSLIGAGIGEIEWIPHTHRLVYNWTVQTGAGDYFATPEIFLLDADVLTETVLARDIPIDPVKQMDIIPSPEGGHLALITSTGLSFLSVDGSDRRDQIFPYSVVGVSSPPKLMPTGVWTQEGRAFATTGALEMDEQFNIGFSIWRVPVDGSAPEALTPALNGRPDSVTFSPDGRRVAFLDNTGGALIASLAGEIGPLATVHTFEPESYANLHWSPAGDIFTEDLLQLCPDASSGSELCATPFNTHVSGVVAIQWLDGERALFLTNAPYVLFLSRLHSPPTLIDFSGSFDAVLVSR